MSDNNRRMPPIAEEPSQVDVDGKSVQDELSKLTAFIANAVNAVNGPKAQIHADSAAPGGVVVLNDGPGVKPK